MIPDVRRSMGERFLGAQGHRSCHEKRGETRVGGFKLMSKGVEGSRVLGEVANVKLIIGS